MKRFSIIILVLIGFMQGEAGEQKTKTHYQEEGSDHLTLENFEDITSDDIILVEFFARWNKDASLSFLHSEDFDFDIYVVDVDLEPELTYAFGIHAVPALVFLFDGEEFFKIQSGSRFKLDETPDELIEILDDAYYEFLKYLESSE